MKTFLKIAIAFVIGLLTTWLCYQVFHLEQIAASVGPILVALAAYHVCDKLMTKK